MRNLYLLNTLRDTSRDVIKFYGSIGDDISGAFTVPSPLDKFPMRVIATAGDDWDHVSVSRNTRCPDWTEMEYVKRLFFKEDEVAMQLHVAVKDHVNCHPFCLHLWRPWNREIPLPPSIFVG